LNNSSRTKIVIVDPETALQQRFSSAKRSWKMDPDEVNTAVVAAIKGSKIPRIHKEKVLEMFGTEHGELLAERVSELLREAVAMPIDWGSMTLWEGVNVVMRRFGERHPELSQEALHEIGRCVGWNLR
jgi:hypothetical protein